MNYKIVLVIALVLVVLSGSFFLTSTDECSDEEIRKKIFRFEPHTEQEIQEMIPKIKNRLGCNG